MNHKNPQNEQQKFPIKSQTKNWGKSLENIDQRMMKIFLFVTNKKFL
jgi:hypothetical protein